MIVAHPNYAQKVSDLLAEHLLQLLNARKRMISTGSYVYVICVAGHRYVFTITAFSSIGFRSSSVSDRGMLRRQALVPPECHRNEVDIPANTLRPTPRLKVRLRRPSISFVQNRPQSSNSSSWYGDGSEWRGKVKMAGKSQNGGEKS